MKTRRLKILVAALLVVIAATGYLGAASGDRDYIQGHMIPDTLSYTYTVAADYWNWGAAGVKIAHDGDGALTFTGLGNGSDEDLTMNLDDTANTVVLTSSTGADTITGLNSYGLGAAGVKMTGDGDGAITFLGQGNGSDEDLTINLDDTANTAVVSSSTGVTALDVGAISLTTTGNMSGVLKASGHAFATGTAPTASAGTMATTSTDHVGMITTVGATSTIVTFASAYTAEPACIATAEEAVTISGKTTAGFTISAVGNIDDVSFACWELE